MFHTAIGQLRARLLVPPIYTCVCFLQVMSMSEGPVDGVEFLPLDFSQRPSEHRHLDVILHKLSEDIMYRWATVGK